MKVSAERIEDSQVVLNIEVDQERLDSSLNKAYRKLVQKTAVPGFRKGKAPREMLERYLGKHRLLHEALDILVPEVYQEAVQENNLEPIDQPELELLQEEPPIIKATVPVQPTIELGDYRSVRVEREAVEPDTSEVDRALEDLRHRYAVHEPVERPVQFGDIIRLDIKADVGDEVFLNSEDVEVRLREDNEVIFAGFAEQLIGMAQEVEKKFSLTVPDDFPEEEYRGKTCDFAVLIRDVKQEQLPDLNDDFAQEVGEGFPNLKALREHLEADARSQLENEAESAYQQKALDELVERTEKIEFPPVLLEREIDRLLREEARAYGQDVDRYLEQLKLTPEELRERFRDQAEERLRRSLVMSRIAELENLSVEHEEIDAEIERMAASAGPQANQMRALFASAAGHDAIGRSILTRKTLERISAIASGSELPEPAAEAAAQAAAEAAAEPTETEEPEEKVSVPRRRSKGG
ncbi:MAG TPA: trigger factor [Dehalococcoidia bacterium]|nr:trigger factor [Dehalococcoidia bacterium]